ncbi:hypothetical protein TTHERM_000301899 (macronuclear) [Tetrahymena thermophila SB210]|uniref:Uncharacterized protein n=1 Tax=Tetrahymena thermophila (strain SB210) TaxID=312017 RepID=W7WYD7_TETTS|nr:hypothetical protein TTHERM_000301899 [Tetrahymena thermophila SB210]EWS71875.1 hypothetical protein TTHERM_000301899 [Tetrahymena thermophila SB210]|eukprot:XP_012655619.1 hypothetical protein TTHERM_000301899 [Tetrahymena thermophila SB210]
MEQIYLSYLRKSTLEIIQKFYLNKLFLNYLNFLKQYKPSIKMSTIETEELSLNNLCQEGNFCQKILNNFDKLFVKMQL